MTDESIYTRTEMMLGSCGVEKLKAARVIIFGVGGVGGHAVEAIARAGVGKIDLVDPDTVGVTNLNRQLIATEKTLGMPKVEAMRERILEINPSCLVTTYQIFYSEETECEIDLSGYDYIVDAIDSIPSKLLLAKKAKDEGIRIISSMGAGNKLDPTRFRVGDIYKTSHDPLARAMRSRLRALGVDALKVVWSDEEPFGERAAGAPGSISFVPGAVGLILAGEVIKDIALER